MHRHRCSFSIFQCTRLFRACALMMATATPANASLLTGLVVVATDTLGGAPGSGGGIWSTSTQNWWKLWVNEGPIGGSFLNGPDASGAGLNIPMTEGIHTFTIQGAGSYIGADYFALNMFFNGQTAATQISAYAPLQQTTVRQPFFVNHSQQTSGMDLDFLPAAGTLTFVETLTTVTLTDFGWSRPEVFGQDRIGPLTTFRDGEIEFVGQLTVQVTVVPEPASLSIWAVCLVTCVVAAQSNRRRGFPRIAGKQTCPRGKALQQT